MTLNCYKLAFEVYQLKQAIENLHPEYGLHAMQNGGES
jgi:hypothetical protein